ncbi:MAG: DUF4956 domain-containing protein [Clostridiales bacterium]|nr:DUF4956 domain-containing protein [Clostridiales bacterium]
MFESIITTSGLSMTTALICSTVSFVLGIVISVFYMIKNTYTKSFVVTLVILPMIVQVIIMMVNGNLGTGVAIMGAFSLIRFRSAPGSSKEIAAVFLSMAIGLATGMGYITFAAIMAILISAIMLLLNISKFGDNSVSTVHQLKITVPEQLDYDTAFEPLLKKYTKKYTLEKVKTTNMGSLFELTYIITMKNNKEQKAMIDDIRCRNGNLTVMCGRLTNDVAEL